MKDHITISIIFDRKTLKPLTIYLNGGTDEETARLKKVVDRMIFDVDEGYAQN